MSCDTILFDLDGTLLNTLDDLAASVRYALRCNDLPARTTEEVCSFVGNGIPRLIALAVPEGTPPAVEEKVLADFRAHYALHAQDTTAPYPGIPEMLKALAAKGFRMGVVSNKSDAEVKALIRHFFFPTITVAIGDAPGRARKPCADSLFAALEELGSCGSRSVYVGDSDVDILTAQNAGIPCISVAWGFRSVEFLRAHGARKIVEDPVHLYSLFTE